MIKLIKALSIGVLVILLAFGCSEILEEPVVTELPDFDSQEDNPEATIQFPVENYTHTVSNEITIMWKGSSAPEGEFLYYLNHYDEAEGSWVTLDQENTYADENWVSDTLQTFEFLDEGQYEFFIWEQNINGIVQDNPTSVMFNVDAVKGPALLLKKQRIFTRPWNQFELDIIAHEVEHMVGLEFEIDFSDFNGAILEVNKGEDDYYSLSGNNHLFNHTPLVQSNRESKIKFSIVMVSGNPEYMSGDICLATMSFRTYRPAEDIIRFSQSSVKMRDENNEPVIVNQLVGSVVITE